MKEVTNNLKATRKKLSKTQAQVAKELGMLKELYQKYEYGMSSKTIQTAIRIAKALNSTVEELWGEKKQRKENLR